jgi:hypothetical protein
VHLVDHHQADVYLRERFHERALAQPLGSGVEEAVAPVGDAAQAPRRLVGFE